MEIAVYIMMGLCFTTLICIAVDISKILRVVENFNSKKEEQKNGNDD